MKKLLLISTNYSAGVELLNIAYDDPFFREKGWSVQSVVLTIPELGSETVEEVLSRISRQASSVDAAIFDNCSVQHLRTGFGFISDLCTEFVKLNPDSIVNYHYTEEGLLPAALEQLLYKGKERKERTNFHYSFTNDLNGIVNEMKGRLETSRTKVSSTDEFETFTDRVSSTSPS